MGSSPLARGLPHQASLSGRQQSRDHPRSRGVYLVDQPARVFVVGSSPLARGLHDDEEHARLGVRIIPARAGFTRGFPAAGAPAWDHPRSRGVYPTTGTRRFDETGSSPLARGLRHHTPPSLVVVRIIPARAGFTCGLRGQCTSTWDHPRSRGVYAVCAVALRSAPGSSPLARGLLIRVGADSNPSGIIPARAGFTPRGSCASCERGDHPRSRGVYVRRIFSSSTGSGSSPLARGLRRDRQVRCDPVRIIPARAGFTLPRGRTGRAYSDHPRSRGVYLPIACWFRITLGSSPLARGLLARVDPRAREGRIIPARAGFTARW